jgi:dihydrofolate reductase
MARLIVYNSVSLDGYFAGPGGDLSWAYMGSDDAEWTAFVAENARRGMKGEGRLLFGRVMYEMMAAYWPTPAAAEALPAVAGGMNAMPKIVFSRTLKQASWQNTTLLDKPLAVEVQRLKKGPGDIVIFGSGTIVAQLAGEGLIDEYQVVVCPIALGRGRSMFDGLKEPLPMRLSRSRNFRNGKVFLSYEPAGGS